MPLMVWNTTMIMTLMMILNMMMIFSLTLMTTTMQPLMTMTSLKKTQTRALTAITTTAVTELMSLWWRTLTTANQLMSTGLGSWCSQTVTWMKLMSLGRWYRSIKCSVTRTFASELWRTPRTESGMSWPWRFTYSTTKVWIISPNCP